MVGKLVPTTALEEPHIENWKKERRLCKGFFSKSHRQFCNYLHCQDLKETSVQKAKRYSIAAKEVMRPIRGNHNGSFLANLLREVQIASCTVAEWRYPWLHIKNIFQVYPRPPLASSFIWWKMSCTWLQQWCNIMCSWQSVFKGTPTSMLSPENELGWKGLCHLEIKHKANAEADGKSELRILTN